MEQLHSAWGLLFILGLFSFELSYNALVSRRRKQVSLELGTKKTPLRPYAMQRNSHRTKIS